MHKYNVIIYVGLDTVISGRKGHLAMAGMEGCLVMTGREGHLAISEKERDFVVSGREEHCYVWK